MRGIRAMGSIANIKNKKVCAPKHRLFILINFYILYIIGLFRLLRLRSCILELVDDLPLRSLRQQTYYNYKCQ